MNDKKELILSNYMLPSDEAKYNPSKIALDIFQKKMQAQTPDLPFSYLVDFLHKAQMVGANPFLNQIYLIPRRNPALGHSVGVIVFAYHYLIDVANRTGELEGFTVDCAVEKIYNPIKKEIQDELVATAKVKRKGRIETTFKARFSEFYDGRSPNWQSKPYVMLQKSAIANCFRWVFPESLSGIMIEEEINDEHLTDISDGEKVQKIIEQTNTLEDRVIVIESIKKELGLKCIAMIPIEKIKYFQSLTGLEKFDQLKELTIDELKTILQKIKE